MRSRLRDARPLSLAGYSLARRRYVSGAGRSANLAKPDHRWRIAYSLVSRNCVWLLCGWLTR